MKALTGIPADRGQSYRSIESYAVGFRELIGVDPLARLDVRRLFEEQIGDVVIGSRSKSIKVVEAVESCPQEGLTRWDSGSERMEVVISDQTYSLLGADHVRARSTVCHEVGHALIHTEQIIRLAGLSLVSQVAFHRERNPHKPFMDTEWQANAFSSALLMPASGISKLRERHGSLTPLMIAEHFGVSSESASYRLQSYGRAI